MTGQVSLSTHQFRPNPPYDFAITSEYATYNSDRYAADTLESGVFSRGLDIDGSTIAVQVSSIGTLDQPRLEIRIVGNYLDASQQTRVVKFATGLVGAHNDLRPFYAAIDDADPVGEFASRLRGLGIPQSPSPFEALVLAILGQQISNQVARVLRNLLVETLGETVGIGAANYRTFPTAEAIAAAGPDALRAIKFSARKSEYICDIAAAVASGELDLDSLRYLPSETTVDELVKLRGVGPWTAHWLLIRAYGHPDGFPHGDLAVQRNLGILFNDGVRLGPEEALDLSERWKPYRSYLTTYLFAAARAGMIGAGSGQQSVGP